MKELKIGDYTVRISNQVNDLIKRRYDENDMVIKDISPSSFIIECLYKDNIVGSASIDLEAKNFSCNISYSDRLKELLNIGSKPIEITKLVVERGEDFKWVVGIMFNLMYRICVIRNGATHMVMECRPNHVAGYRRFFKFDVIDGPTYNQVVNGDVYFLVMDIEKTTGLAIK